MQLEVKHARYKHPYAGNKWFKASVLAPLYSFGHFMQFWRGASLLVPGAAVFVPGFSFGSMQDTIVPTRAAVVHSDLELIQDEDEFAEINRPLENFDIELGGVDI